MTKTGTELATDALRAIQVLDPTATASGEALADALRVAGDLLDSWRVQKLTLGGIVINTYNLVASTQEYTIGSGGTFDQAYPESIVLWSVVPDDDAADPVEIPMGRPLTFTEWQQIRVKSLEATRPTALYFDGAYSAGLGTVSVYPIPDNNDVDVKLYTHVPAITALVAATSYDMRPGFSRALTLTLALELADGYGRAAQVTPRLEKRAENALMVFKRSQIRPQPSGIRPEFVIGSGAGRRTYNIYVGS